MLGVHLYIERVCPLTTIWRTWSHRKFLWTNWGLLIVARMYHWHIAVITKKYTWTTGWDKKLTDCRVVFAYGGGVNFSLVCDRPTDLPPLQKCPLNLAKRKPSSTELGMEPPKKRRRTKSSNDGHTKPSNDGHTKPSKGTRRKPRRSKRLIKVPLPYRVVTLQPRTTKNSHKAAKSASKISLDNILHGNRKRQSAPKSLAEEDPIAPHISDPSEVEDNKSDHESDYVEDKNVKVETIKTSDGSLAIARHGLVCHERKVKEITCPLCKELLYSQKKMNLHMLQKHPTFHFQCGLCEDQFKSYNAAYRHTQRHFKLRYKCSYCDHRSQYPKENKTHKRTHTNKGLLPCPTRGCTRKFTSKKLMWQHTQSHSPDSWKCTTCNPERTFDTYSNYRQHNKGLHGTGWRALCRYLCKWPYIRARHQKKCTKCQEIMADRANKPENLKKFTRRNLAKLKESSSADPKVED